MNHKTASRLTSFAKENDTACWSLSFLHGLSIRLNHVLRGLSETSLLHCNTKKQMRPDYYKSEGLEVFDIIDKFHLNFFLGNVVKYVCRAGKKPSTAAIDDLEKAKTYIEYEIERAKTVYQKSKIEDIQGLLK